MNKKKLFMNLETIFCRYQSVSGRHNYYLTSIAPTHQILWIAFLLLPGLHGVHKQALTILCLY